MAREKRFGGRTRTHNRRYDRRVGISEPKETILIVCNGTETEPKYFNALKRHLGLRSVTVRVARGDCRKCVQEAADGRDDYDQCWCVWDTESLDSKDVVDEALRTAKQEKLNPAISNPAFEYWFLLHYRHTDRPFKDAAAVIHELRRYFPEYEKTADAYSVLKDCTDAAISNAESVLKAHRAASNYRFPNPSTSVHKLVVALHDLKGEKG